MQPSKQPTSIHASFFTCHVVFQVAQSLFLITDACMSSAYSFANRLYDIKENHKFQKNGRQGHREEGPANGLAHIVSEIKRKHELKYDVLC